MIETPKLMLFDLTNNVNHASFRMTNPIEVIVIPLPNHLDAMVHELITLAQVLVEEMTISSKCDVNENDEDAYFWSPSLEVVFFEDLVMAFVIVHLVFHAFQHMVYFLLINSIWG
jgi:hypothetical protein